MGNIGPDKTPPVTTAGPSTIPGARPIPAVLAPPTTPAAAAALPAPIIPITIVNANSKLEKTF